MITLFLRTIIIYLILLISMRLTGKRQIGEFQVTEFIVTFMLSELATLPIIDRGIPLSYAVIPILLLLSLEVVFSFAISKSPWLKRLMFGSPGVLISRGRIIQKELARNRIDANELLSELRLKDISDVSEVEYAIIEDNGKLSVIKKTESSPITHEFRDKKPIEHGLAHPVIIAGKVSTRGLEMSDKTPSWLKSQLRDADLRPDDIFLMTVDDAGRVNIIKKEVNI